MKKNVVKPGPNKLQINSQRIRTIGGGELGKVFGGYTTVATTGYLTSNSELWSTCGIICC